MPKVQVTKNGQHTLTVPDHIVRAMNIQKGDEFFFQIGKSGNIELVKYQGGSIYVQ